MNKSQKLILKQLTDLGLHIMNPNLCEACKHFNFSSMLYLCNLHFDLFAFSTHPGEMIKSEKKPLLLEDRAIVFWTEDEHFASKVVYRI